ncbi:MAG: hypothetical protein Q7S95_00460 [bacterium]|nr:hypothetical protein [bacterium]
MAIRLKLMPLVRDFGEILEHPLQVLHPNTALVLTRDYRIFGQLSNFPDTDRDARRPRHVRVNSLPPGLKIIVTSEDFGTVYTREDEAGYEMGLVSAKVLKKLVIPDDTSPTNKAVKAYIDQLQDDTPIITGWL